jgi:hypothetical protein
MQLIYHSYRAIQSLFRLPVDAHDELGAPFHGLSSALVHAFCSRFMVLEPLLLLVNASAPGIPLAKAIYKAVPSLTFGHGALSTFLARISKGGIPQVSVKGFLQQLTPAVAVLSPAILVHKSAQVSAPAPPPPATPQVSPYHLSCNPAHKWHLRPQPSHLMLLYPPRVPLIPM